MNMCGEKKILLSLCNLFQINQKGSTFDDVFFLPIAICEVTLS